MVGLIWETTIRLIEMERAEQRRVEKRNGRRFVFSSKAELLADCCGDFDNKRTRVPSIVLRRGNLGLIEVLKSALRR